MPIDIVTQHTSILVKIGVEKMKNEERNLFITAVTNSQIVYQSHLAKFLTMLGILP